MLEFISCDVPNVLFCGVLVQQQERTSSTGQHIPLIKPQKPGIAIPDFFMVPPDEQQKRATAVKSQLLSALQPTPDTVSAVSQDSTLMAGAPFFVGGNKPVRAACAPTALDQSQPLLLQALMTQKLWQQWLRWLVTQRPLQSMQRTPRWVEDNHSITRLLALMAVLQAVVASSCTGAAVVL